MNIPTAAELKLMFPINKDTLEVERAVKSLIHGMSSNSYTTIDGEHYQWVRVPAPCLSPVAIEQLNNLGYDYITTYTYVLGEEFVNYAIRIAHTTNSNPFTTPPRPTRPHPYRPSKKLCLQSHIHIPPFNHIIYDHDHDHDDDDDDDHDEALTFIPRRSPRLYKSKSK